MTTQDITVSELVNILLAAPINQFVGIHMDTPLSNMLDKGGRKKPVNPHHSGRKIARVNGRLYRYDRDVDCQRKREGHPEDFKAKKSTVGEFVGPALKYNANKKRYYMTYRLNRSYTKAFLGANGESLSWPDISPWLKKSYNKQPKTQETDKPVYHREVALDNIISVKINGVLYRIVK